MKSFALALAVSVALLISAAEGVARVHQPSTNHIDRAYHQLSFDLDELAQVANAAANRAHFSGIPTRATRLSAVSDSAIRLNNDLHRVFSYSHPSRRNTIVRQQNFTRLSPDFQALARQISSIIIPVPELNTAHRAVELSRSQLDQALSGGTVGPRPRLPYPGRPPVVRPPVPQPLSASCVLDVGGNWLRPQSKIECNIFGRGANAYEITVNGRTTWNGMLNSRSNRQVFETDKKRVGGHSVSYEVFVLDTFGRRHLVHRF